MKDKNKLVKCIDCWYFDELTQELAINNVPKTCKKCNFKNPAEELPLKKRPGYIDEIGI